MMPRRFSLSVSVRGAVGSSRISSLARLDRALAISTSCCRPMPRLITGVSGFTRRPTRSKKPLARRTVSWSWITPWDVSSSPRKMFSAMFIFLRRASS